MSIRNTIQNKHPMYHVTDQRKRSHYWVAMTLWILLHIAYDWPINQTHNSRRNKWILYRESPICWTSRPNAKWRYFSLQIKVPVLIFTNSCTSGETFTNQSPSTVCHIFVNRMLFDVILSHNYGQLISKIMFRICLILCMDFVYF